MQTQQIYYQDPYKKTLKTFVEELKIDDKGQMLITFPKTIFFPKGGGQPGDRGEVTTKTSKNKILHQKIQDEKIIHICKINEDTQPIQIYDNVNLDLDWDWRYKYMKIHSAGHLLHDVIQIASKDKLTPIKALHGKHAHIEYQGNVSPDKIEEFTKVINNLIQEDLPITTANTTLAELKQVCPYLPPNIPNDKQLRYIKIGDFAPMPDGGVQVKSTKEIGKMRITSIQNANNKTKITYQIINTTL